jgi:RNA polymerase sigma-70 factor, ECF subfamily
LSSIDSHHVTTLLHAIRNGDQDARDQLILIVYPELRKIAAKRLRAEHAHHTWQPTDLVNEAYLRIFRSKPVDLNNRIHFFAVAARQMRFALIDHARQKKHGEVINLTFDAHGEAGVEKWKQNVMSPEDLISIHEALQKLEELDPRAAQGIELRFFGGLTFEAAADVLQIDAATVKRDWVFAKSWLFNLLNPTTVDCDKLKP